MKVNRADAMVLSMASDSSLQDVSAFQVVTAQDADYWVLGSHR